MDFAVRLYVEKELAEYKKNLKKKISKHFTNQYCANTDIDKVMYEKEIIKLIDKIKLE